jgi:hypothetical protein
MDNEGDQLNICKFRQYIVVHKQIMRLSYTFSTWEKIQINKEKKEKQIGEKLKHWGCLTFQLSS